MHIVWTLWDIVLSTEWFHHPACTWGNPMSAIDTHQHGIMHRSFESVSLPTILPKQLSFYLLDCMYVQVDEENRECSCLVHSWTPTDFSFPVWVTTQLFYVAFVSMHGICIMSSLGLPIFILWLQCFWHHQGAWQDVASSCLNHTACVRIVEHPPVSAELFGVIDPFKWKLTAPSLILSIWIWAFPMGVW